MATIAVTGSAGGIGKATRARLESAGHRVVGVDVADAEVIADLSTPEGRAAMVDGVAAACDGVLDGVVAGAGIRSDDGPATVAVNYFGAVATLDGLRPLLARGTGAAAVALSSNTTSTLAGLPGEVVERCLAGDEDGAKAAATDGIGDYGATKLALARWVRRQATTGDWAGAGIRLNAVAPGFIDTAMTAGTWDMVMSLGDDLFPVPQGRPGRPEEVAGLIAYLLSPDAAFFCGSVVFMDGGTDAALRPDDWPSPRP
jgi:NAD(P)-dependent dehydrogenase (short-subunit alcohol dehydrogenase family)